MIAITNQKGVALGIALIVLLAVSLITIPMLKSTIFLDRIASNNREKEVASQYAQTAINAVENWLVQGSNAGTGSPCSPGSSMSNTLTVCSNDFSASIPVNSIDPTVPTSWQFGTSLGDCAHLPAYCAPTTLPGGQTMAAAPPYSPPEVYIRYLGTLSIGTLTPQRLYQITAAATGGNPYSVAVIQTVFAVQATIAVLGS